MTGSYKLRPLERKDAPYMLEWMRDETIACFFRFDAQAMTLESCEDFIAHANDRADVRHYAVVGDADEYLGTVSLKEIDTETKRAEYAISMRRCAHGTGAAAAATRAILRVAFEELGLQQVYLNVLTDNGRANRFYEKMGFQYQNTTTRAFELCGRWRDLNWYIWNKD